MEKLLTENHQDGTKLLVSDLELVTSIDEMPTRRFPPESNAPIHQAGVVLKRSWVIGTARFERADTGLMDSPTGNRSQATTRLTAQIAPGDVDTHRYRLMLWDDTLVVYLPSEDWADLADAVKNGRVEQVDLEAVTDALRARNDPMLYRHPDRESGIIHGRVARMNWKEPRPKPPVLAAPIERREMPIIGWLAVAALVAIVVWLLRR